MPSIKGSTALCVVYHGDAYKRYADELFYSALKFFHPTDDLEFVVLHGRAGWPDATMYRPQVLLDNFPTSDYVFLCDADMLCVAPIGVDILPMRGMTATLHPGYVSTPVEQFPYERNPESAAYIAPGEGSRYYAGGFVGGKNKAMKEWCRGVAQIIDIDAERDFTPTWHDESASNRYFAVNPPDVVLPPSYCFPEGNQEYYKAMWPVKWEPKLLAREKTQEERGAR